MSVKFIEDIIKENSTLKQTMIKRCKDARMTYDDVNRCLAFYLHYNEGKIHPEENGDEDLAYKKPIPTKPLEHPNFPLAQPHIVMPESMPSIKIAYEFEILPLLKPR